MIILIGTRNESSFICLPKISGLQKGPAERGQVKKRQKSSKSVKKCVDTFRHFSRRAKNVQNVKKRRKVFRQFSRGTFFPAPFGYLSAEKALIDVSL